MTDTRRNFSDDMLSSYLDGELPAMEMAAVRAALEQDLSLADRLATLALADKLVRRHAEALDGQALPAPVLALLARAQPAAVARQILPARWYRRARPLALAASVVLVLGLALGYLNRSAPILPLAGMPELAQYAEHLDNAPSGTTVNFGTATLLARFTFRNHNDQYCRLYQLVTAGNAAEHVACRQDGAWSLLASVPLPAPDNADTYRPASSPASEVDALLDTLMQGPALDLAAEAALMEGGW